MPQLAGEPIIRHAWRPRGDRDNIHYLAINLSGRATHLRARPGEPLYDILLDALVSVGHPGVSYPGRWRGGIPDLDARCT